MATFISSFRFTGQGFKGVGDTTKRAAAAKAAAKKMGIKVSDFYWTMGEYDGVMIFQAPDDETATALMLQVGAQGNVRTTTVRAFSAQEMDGILATAGG